MKINKQKNLKEPNLADTPSLCGKNEKTVFWGVRVTQEEKPKELTLGRDFPAGSPPQTPCSEILSQRVHRYREPKRHPRPGATGQV